VRPTSDVRNQKLHTKPKGNPGKSGSVKVVESRTKTVRMEVEGTRNTRDLPEPFNAKSKNNEHRRREQTREQQGLEESSRAAGRVPVRKNGRGEDKTKGGRDDEKKNNDGVERMNYPPFEESGNVNGRAT